MKFEDYARAIVHDSIAQHQTVLERCRDQLVPKIIEVGKVVKEAVNSGNKLMLCGNGGSAADAQHIAAEFVGRYLKERPPLWAVALTTDTSILTSLGNDYSFDEIFVRQIAAIARPGDVLVAISTSGNSANILRAVATAKEAGCATVGLLGRDGGSLAPMCDHAIIVPADETPRIQEMHIMIGHMLCEFMEDAG